MSAALSKPKFRSLIKRHFNKSITKEDSLSALNTSYTIEGVFIYIPKKIVAEKPKNLESSDGEDQHVRFHGAPDLISPKIAFHER